MKNVIIEILLVLIFALAIVKIVKDSNKKSCCGSGNYKPIKKKINKVIQTKIFKIEGMSCQNCANRILEKLNDIDGISSTVEFKKGLAKIQYEKEVNDKYILDAIERAGYRVI